MQGRYRGDLGRLELLLPPGLARARDVRRLDRLVVAELQLHVRVYAAEAWLGLELGLEPGLGRGRGLGLGLGLGCPNPNPNPNPSPAPKPVTDGGAQVERDHAVSADDLSAADRLALGGVLGQGQG